MARHTLTLETITCDYCGKEVSEATTVVLGWGKDQWELDLCPSDYKRVENQFDKMVESGRRVKKSSSRAGVRAAQRTPLSDWDYLESIGFTKHRGRKTAAETAALAARRG